MVGWHHRFNGHEFEQTLGHSEGQGTLACCSPWGRKESDMTELLNNKSYCRIPQNCLLSSLQILPSVLLAFSQMDLHLHPRNIAWEEANA